jgi:hypothetical protein
MSNRYSEVVILAEDERSANLLRRYVLHTLAGNRKDRRELNRRIRQLISPSAQGDAKRWVLHHYPIEVKALRCIRKKTGLVVHLDADTATVAKRAAELAAALKRDGQDKREADERVCHAIPKRHTETWLCVLTGVDVDEQRDCKRDRVLPDFDAAVQPAAFELYNLTRANVPAPSLPSLATAVPELRRLEA